MPVGDVGQLVRQHGRQLVVRAHKPHHASGDVDPSARDAQSVHPGDVDDPKMIRQILAVHDRDERIPHARKPVDHGRVGDDPIVRFDLLGDLRAEPDLVGGLICTDGGGTAKESADRDPDEGNAHPANRPRSSMRSAHRSILIILSPDRDPPRTHL